MLSLALATIPAAAQSVSPPEEEPYSGQVLCQPGVYLNIPQDCLALGPSQYLTDLARDGIVYPTPPLAAAKINPELAVIPYQYIRIVVREALPLYTSLPDAMAKNVSRYLKPGNRYLAYSDRQETPEGIYYLISTGEWVDGNYVSRISPPSFEGFAVRSTPSIPFGWILDTTDIYIAPDFNAEKNGHILNRFDLVTVYNTMKVGESDWYLVGQNEWVEKRFISVVYPNTTPPQGVTNGRWIELNLYHQTMTVYENHKMIFATLISSGMDPFFTQPGLFQIYEKLPTETMSTGNDSDYYYLEEVPWTMYFDQARALHGSYWNSLFGYPRSHGCVNLSMADSRWLFDWANIGDWVYAWDPSGNTPTDPSFYTQGGP